MRREDVRSQEGPRWYRRMLYAPELEARAFHCLAERDPDGCRRALLRLVGRLELSALGDDPRPAIQLLLDVLHKLNAALHPGPRQEARYQRNRLALIQEFAACDSAEAARGRFVAALDRLLDRRTDGGRSAQHLVRRAKLYIESSYQRRISLSTVAGALHISANYLSRIFRRETGMTLTSFVQRVRLEKARALMAEGGYTISEIAYRVGYQNYRDFYRNFVKYEEASPRQVRRRLSRRSTDVS